MNNRITQHLTPEKEKPAGEKPLPLLVKLRVVCSACGARYVLLPWSDGARFGEELIVALPDRCVLCGATNPPHPDPEDQDG